jgi:hypothetical protein
VNAVISSVILAGAVIALSFGVFAWSQFRTSDYAQNYAETTHAEISKLKERLTVEFIAYNSSSETVIIYLLNYGVIDNVKIQRVTVQNYADYNEDFPVTQLTFLNGTINADASLDRGDGGYIIIGCGSLTEGKYFVSILTERRSIFDTEFEV